jgi:hypothetical protein
MLEVGAMTESIEVQAPEERVRVADAQIQHAVDLREIVILLKAHLLASGAPFSILAVRAPHARNEISGNTQSIGKEWQEASFEPMSVPAALQPPSERPYSGNQNEGGYHDYQQEKLGCTGFYGPRIRVYCATHHDGLRRVRIIQ